MSTSACRFLSSSSTKLPLTGRMFARFSPVGKLRRQDRAEFRGCVNGLAEHEPEQRIVWLRRPAARCLRRLISLPGLVRPTVTVPHDRHRTDGHRQPVIVDERGVGTNSIRHDRSRSGALTKSPSATHSPPWTTVRSTWRVPMCAVSEKLMSGATPVDTLPAFL
jgi:hypothetical protein